MDFILFGRFEDSASKIIKFYLFSNEIYAIIPSMTKPDVIRQTVIINDDYVRKNRRAEDGHIILKFAQAIHDKNQIILYNNIINKNITLATSAEIKELQHRIDTADENELIAHESQHIHNNLPKHIQNADNIYESMMLSFTDEMSATLAGFLSQTKDIDSAMNKTIEHLSAKGRRGFYIEVFAKHFATFQLLYGKNKKLYEYKYDGKKMMQMIYYFFTINGHNIFQQQVDKATNLKFGAFIVEIKDEMKRFIDNYIQNQILSNQANYTIG